MIRRIDDDFSDSHRFSPHLLTEGWKQAKWQHFQCCQHPYSLWIPASRAAGDPLWPMSNTLTPLTFVTFHSIHWWAEIAGGVLVTWTHDCRNNQHFCTSRWSINWQLVYTTCRVIGYKKLPQETGASYLPICLTRIFIRTHTLWQVPIHWHYWM